MRKRIGALLPVLVLLLLVSGCGGETESGGAESEVSLNSLYAGMAESCGWEEDYMAEVEGELLEEYYPGLSEVPAKQLIVMVPAMSSDVNEIALIQCESDADAERAEEILQARIDSQVEGGAWYAETLESWQKAKTLRHGTYAAMIASGEYQETLEEQFNQQFS